MKDVPTETRRRIMAFLDNLYTQNTAFDEEAILSQLPEHMQHEMYHIMYHKITEHIPFFTNLDEESKAAGEPARAKQGVCGGQTKHSCGVLCSVHQDEAGDGDVG